MSDFTLYHLATEAEVAPGDVLANGFTGEPSGFMFSRIHTYPSAVDARDGMLSVHGPRGNRTTIAAASFAVEWRETAKPEPTTPGNAADRIAAGSLIAELAGSDYVTTTEATAVLEWCRDWVADCYGGREDEDDLAALSDGYVLRKCNRVIDGGLAFVLSDVRRASETAKRHEDATSPYARGYRVGARMDTSADPVPPGVDSPERGEYRQGFEDGRAAQPAKSDATLSGDDSAGEDAHNRAADYDPDSPYDATVQAIKNERKTAKPRRVATSYRVEYQDSRGRWHLRRGLFDTAATAVDAARDLATANHVHGWRVLDADGRTIADHLGQGTASERIRAARETAEPATMRAYSLGAPRTEVTDYADATYTGRGEFYSGMRQGDRVTVRRHTVSYTFQGERKTAVSLYVQSQRDPGAWLFVHRTAAELEDISDFRDAALRVLEDADEDSRAAENATRVERHSAVLAAASAAHLDLSEDPTAGTAGIVAGQLTAALIALADGKTTRALQMVRNAAHNLERLD